MHRTMLRCVAALAVCLVSTAFSPKADAGWFGHFHTRHRASYAPTACCAPVVRAYVAPAPVVVPAPVVAAPSPCTTCAAPAPIQVPETCMQTRCYQVPVTRYETRAAQQLVTENRVSEVMEPVTTMQTSSYYDPCSCGYHNVTTPVTTMVRKQVVTPIQRYVTQHYTVPVTTYEQRCEQVPVTTMRMYVPAGTAPATAAVAVPAPMAVAAPPPAAVVAQAPAPPPAAANGPALQAVPAAPGAPPPQGGPGAINLPNGSESLKQVPRDGVAGYQQPANVNPNRREEISRVFRNNELVEENRRFVDPNEPPATSGSGAPLTPRPQTQPPTTGSSYAIPQDQKPMPRGAKTASLNAPYNGMVTLSKPYGI